MARLPCQRCESASGARFVDEATTTQEFDLLMDPTFDLQARSVAQLVEETLPRLRATQAPNHAFPHPERPVIQWRAQVCAHSANRPIQ